MYLIKIEAEAYSRGFNNGERHARAEVAPMIRRLVKACEYQTSDFQKKATVREATAWLAAQEKENRWKKKGAR